MVRHFSDPIADVIVWISREIVLPVLLYFPQRVLALYFAVRHSPGYVSLETPQWPLYETDPSASAPVDVQPEALNATRADFEPFNHTNWVLALLHQLPLDEIQADSYARSFDRGFVEWTTLIQGMDAKARAVSVGLGYVMLLLAAIAFVGSSTPWDRHDAGRAARREIRQYLVIVKVSICIPLICSLLKIQRLLSSWLSRSYFSRSFVAFNCTSQRSLCSVTQHSLLGSTLCEMHR